MKSLPIRKSVPESLAAPCTVRMFDPIPAIRAPMDTSIRQRSWTWGSEAAFSMTVVPSASTAAMSAFSVAVTEVSSRNIAAPFSLLAESAKKVPVSTRVPSSMSARKCVSRGLRPITSPPGGGSSTRPLRASSGPARRMEARIFCARWGGISSRVMSSVCRRYSLCPIFCTALPSTLEDLDHHVHVLDLGEIAQHDGLVREERGGQAGKRGVLVPARLDPALQGKPAFYDVLVRGHDHIIEGDGA